MTDSEKLDEILLRLDKLEETLASVLYTAEQASRASTLKDVIDDYIYRPQNKTLSGGG